MIHERIYLDENCKDVYIDTYIVDETRLYRDAMLVIPGGGYSKVCTDREGEPIALAYLAAGFNCFVLNYRTGKIPYPEALIDASRAIVHIRQNHEKYHIKKNRVFAVGFSAGGHLAGSLAILHKEKIVLDTLGIKEGENRPDAVILAYPVVSAMMNTHEGSFVNLSGGTPFAEIPDEEKKRLSLECHVDSSSAPAFIWHTAEDTVVPVCGSLALCGKYVEAGVPVTLQVFPYGPHGVCLGTKFTAFISEKHIQPLAEGWIKYSVDWLTTLEK